MKYEYSFFSLLHFLLLLLDSLICSAVYMLCAARHYYYDTLTKSSDLHTIQDTVGVGFNGLFFYMCHLGSTFFFLLCLRFFRQFGWYSCVNSINSKFIFIYVSPCARINTNKTRYLYSYEYKVDENMISEQKWQYASLVASGWAGLYMSYDFL